MLAILMPKLARNSGLSHARFHAMASVVCARMRRECEIVREVEIPPQRLGEVAAALGNELIRHDQSLAARLRPN
jgi:hypothetical protein